MSFICESRSDFGTAPAVTLYKDFGVIILPGCRLSLSLRHIPQRPHPPRNKPEGLNPFHRCARTLHDTQVSEQTTVMLQQVNKAMHKNERV